MFTPSTPASFKSRIESKVFCDSQPFGGSTSTEVTNSPNVILRDQCERSSGGVTWTSGAGASFWSTCAGAIAGAKTLCDRGEAARTASLINLICAGVVPQQPPMNFAPAGINRVANFDMYTGEHM